MNTRRVGVEWRNAVGGLAVLGLLAIVSSFVFFLDSVRRALSEGPQISVLAAEARGLQVGAEVWIAGYSSGRVTKIRFQEPERAKTRRVWIEAVLERDAATFLRRDARARIGSASLLAPAVLKLNPGSREAGAFDFADTLFVPRDTVAETLLTLSAEGRARIDTLRMLLRAVDSAATQGPGSVAGFRSDSALAERLPRLAASLGSIEKSLRRGKGLARVLSDDSLRNAAWRAVGRLESALRDEQAEAVRDTIFDTVAALESLTNRLASLEAGFAAGRGTAGRAAYDTELRDQARALRASLETLRTELAADPLRWLRFRIF